jgi:hypothetical protein
MKQKWIERIDASGTQNHQYTQVCLVIGCHQANEKKRTGMSNAVGPKWQFIFSYP